MIRIVEDLSGDWRRLDERIEQVTEEIEVLARESESCRQLMTVVCGVLSRRWHDIAGWHGMARGCRIRITFRIRDSAIVD